MTPTVESSSEESSSKESAAAIARSGKAADAGKFGRSRSMSDRSTEQPVPWRARCDLIVRQQDSGAWIVKDPLTLTYCLLNEQEMAVLRLLDDRRSMRDLQESLNNAWPGLRLTMDDVAQFVGQLIQNQLVTGSSSSRTRGPAHATRQTADSSLQRAGIFSGNLFRMQFRLLDPTTLLNWLHPLTRVLFSRQAAVLLTALTVIALAMVTLRFDQLTGNLPGPWDFFGPDNLLLLALTFVAVKGLHEAGHALAARRFGAECHEAGVMLILFTPLLYTNVTDAWILDRRSRLIISAAGMIVELALASVAAILWFFAAPGLTKALLTNVMVLCTVGTVLFNGNPLLRYDGYFLLVDAIGEPNLAQRAARQVQSFFRRLLTGPVTLVSSSANGGADTAGEAQRGTPFGGGFAEQTAIERKFVLFYGLCSAAYRVLLTVTILIMLLHLFDHWKLRIAGTILTAVAAASMLAVPAFSVMTGVLAEVLPLPDYRRRLMRMSMILLATVAVMFVPLPCSVIVPAVVEPAGVPVYTTLSGELVSSARYGQRVVPESVIAVLKDPFLQRQQIRFSGEVSVLEARLRAMELNRTGQQNARLPEVRSLLDSAGKRIAKFEDELRRLTVRSPARGILVAPRAVASPVDDATLPAWYGCPLDEGNAGARLSEGTLLGYVCDPEEAEFLLSVTDEERESLAENQNAYFQLTGNPDVVYRGRIVRIAALQSEDVPAELIAAGLAAPPGPGTGNSESRRWQAVMRCAVGRNDVRLPVYSTGMVRVSVAPRSLAERLRRFLKSTFA